MMEEVKEGWRKVKLGEVATEIRETYEPNSLEHLRYIGLEHIEQQTLKLNAIGVSSTTQSTKKIFKPNDILFGSLRPYFRKVIKPKYSGVCSTDITVIRAKKNWHQDFLFYFIANQDFIDFATNYSIGTRMPRANWKVLSKSEWLFPPIEFQRKIAAILSAYDDLIENNTRRILILEEMAQTIYKEWFVKFRFPGYEKVKMVDSELGTIPEGWEVKKVKDIVKRLKAGRTYTQKEVLPMGNIPVIDQSRSEFLGFHNNESDHYTSSEEPIIIFGDHTCKMQIMVEPFSLGPNVIPFISNDCGLIYYLFFLVRNLVETHEYKRHWNELVIKKVALAGKKSQFLFSELIKPLTEEINLLMKRNSNLCCTRDLLLPKLISGEVDVTAHDLTMEGSKV